MNRAERLPWFFDEFRDFGWLAADEIEGYERRVGVDAAAEREQLLGFGLAAEHTFVDLGAGAGSLAIEAAKLCRRVVAVDVSQPMLDHAKKQAAAAGVENIEYVCAGFLTYDHAGDPADIVVTRRALHHLPDFWKMEALLRIHAMLKPSGVFYLEDLVYSFDASEMRRSIDAWIEAVARPAGSPSGFQRAFFEEHVREEWSTYAWIMEGMLERTGFEIVESSFRLGAYASYRCRRR